MQNLNRFELPGSARTLLSGSSFLDQVAPNEIIDVTVKLRTKQDLPSVVARDADGQQQFMTKTQLKQDYGADTEDVAKVTEFVKDYGLTIKSSERDPSSYIVSGPAEAIENAFGTKLNHYDSPQGRYRGREGALFIPESLKGIVTGILGLDNRAVASFHLRRTLPAVQAFTPVQVAQLYRFPATLTGHGQKIGIIELGGGYREDELNQYFTAIEVANPPSITTVSYPGGGANSPGTDPFDPSNPDVEVMLDIQVIGAIATEAEIFVYFAPDASDQSFLNVLAAAIHDPENDLNIISISWGGPEAAGHGGPQAHLTQQFQNNFHQILLAAQQLGTTVCVASGDNASACYPLNDPQRPWDGHSHADYPSSDPLTLACGGTRLMVQDNQIVQEVVWHPSPNVGSGGGISRYFELPAYQQNAGVPAAVNPPAPVMRGVPDVAGNAAQESGYRILCDGQWFPDPANAQIPPIGGTSAVAPLWAALLALANEQRAAGGKKPLGFVNPALYDLPAASGAFNDIIVGNNGDYDAGTGWDPCTGLGSPNGQVLVQELTKLP